MVAQAIQICYGTVCGGSGEVKLEYMTTKKQHEMVIRCVRCGALISSLDKNLASTPKVSTVINTENLLL